MSERYTRPDYVYARERAERSLRSALGARGEPDPEFAAQDQAPTWDREWPWQLTLQNGSGMPQWIDIELQLLPSPEREADDPYPPTQLGLHWFNRAPAVAQINDRFYRYCELRYAEGSAAVRIVLRERYRRIYRIESCKWGSDIRDDEEAGSVDMKMSDFVRNAIDRMLAMFTAGMMRGS